MASRHFPISLYQTRRREVYIFFSRKCQSLTLYRFEKSFLCEYDGHPDKESTYITQRERRPRCSPNRKWEDTSVSRSCLGDSLPSEMGCCRRARSVDYLSDARTCEFFLFCPLKSSDTRPGCTNIRRLAFDRRVSFLFCWVSHRRQEPQG